MQASTYSKSKGTKCFHAKKKKRKSFWSYVFFHPNSEALNKKSVSAKAWYEARLCVCARTNIGEIHIFAAMGNGLGLPQMEKRNLMEHLQHYMCCGSHFNVHCSPGSPLSFFLTSSHLFHMPHPSRLSIGLVSVSINWIRWSWSQWLVEPGILAAPAWRIPSSLMSPNSNHSKAKDKMQAD